MSIPRELASRVGGGTTGDYAATIGEVFAMSGFDPADVDSEWSLVVTDTHGRIGYPESDIPAGIREEITKLQGTPPDQVISLGDVLTDYAQLGVPAEDAKGIYEAAQANKLFDELAKLAPVSVIMGNHDGELNESVRGEFLRTNFDHFDALDHTVDVGGVRFILVSGKQDASLEQSQLDYIVAACRAAPSGADIVIGAHHPGGGRSITFAGFAAICDAIPVDVTNDLFFICGHVHSYSTGVTHQLAGTTILKVSLGAAAADSWVFFGDDRSCMSAFACVDGKMHSRYQFDGRIREWRLLPEFDRSTITPLARQLDGLDNETIAGTPYIVGEFTAGDFIAGEGSTTWRDVGTFLAFAYDLTPIFPIPSGATKFWTVSAEDLDVVKMSNDGSSWTTISGPHTRADEATILEIPVGLRGGTNLHIHLTNSSQTLSAFGFAS